MGNLIGWGRAPEYQLPVCVSIQVYTLLDLFVEAFYSIVNLHARMSACIFVEAARLQTYLQIFNTTVHVCVIVS